MTIPEMEITINAFIVEDEAPSLSAMQSMLGFFPEIKIIGFAKNGRQAIQLINQLKPELVFLDVQLPGISGIEVLKELSYSPWVVFTTAYSQYAVSAFELNGVDYILKPVTRERLHTAILRVLEKKKSRDFADRQNQLLDPVIINSLQQLLEQKNKLKQFTVRSEDHIRLIPQEEVYYFKAEEKYVFLYTFDCFHFYNHSLRRLETQINNDLFCRISKSHIIALDKIDKIVRNFPQGFKLILKDKKHTAIKIGRKYIADLKTRLHLK